MEIPNNENCVLKQQIGLEANPYENYEEEKKYQELARRRAILAGNRTKQLKNNSQSALKRNVNQSRSFSIENVSNQDETYDSKEFTGTVNFKEGSMSNKHKENLILFDPSKFDKEFSLKNIPSITPSCISINVRIINMLENYIKE